MFETGLNEYNISYKLMFENISLWDINDVFVVILSTGKVS